MDFALVFAAFTACVFLPVRRGRPLDSSRTCTSSCQNKPHSCSGNELYFLASDWTSKKISSQRRTRLQEQHGQQQPDHKVSSVLQVLFLYCYLLQQSLRFMRVHSALNLRLFTDVVHDFNRRFLRFGLCWVSNCMGIRRDVGLLLEYVLYHRSYVSAGAAVTYKVVGVGIHSSIHGDVT